MADRKQYGTGPMITYKDGALSLHDRKLMDVPAGEWIRIETEGKSVPMPTRNGTLSLRSRGKRRSGSRISPLSTRI
jgi:hypothetical protein